MNFGRMPFEVERADINMFGALKDKILESEPEYGDGSVDGECVGLIK